MSLTLHAANRSQVDFAAAALLASIDREDQILSTWKRDSEVSRWLGTRGQSVRLSPELLEVLGLFDHWQQATGGALNPSAEAAARLWLRASADGRQPSTGELAEAVAAMQGKHWSLDPADGTAMHLSDSPLALASFTKSYIAGHAADAALAAGATGVMLNVGGDIVVRGSLAQAVDIAHPLADAENAAPLDRVVVRDRAVVTSGSYRRGFRLTEGARPEFSHIIDPRTAQPAGHILSSTVIARDPATAGALATAFSIMSVDESRSLAARTGGVDYLLYTADGRRIASEGWSKYQAPMLRTVAYAPPRALPAPKAAGAAEWNANFELDINLQLAQIEEARYHRPYVAVWVEGADHHLVRTISVWSGKPRYIPELRSWYHLAQATGNADAALSTVSSATRSPGSYTLKWDGKDDAGKLVAAGEYSICIEVTREHGTYQIIRQPMDFTGKSKQVTLPASTEIGGATLDYHKR